MWKGQFGGEVMIISRTPLRITLGGGGTDLPSFYERYGGFLISATINKHVYVSVNHQFYDSYSLKYSKIENQKDINNIQHNLFRESLRLLNIKPGIEITSIADIPSGTGLGSSGSFLISLLNTLHEYKGQHATKRQLAEESCKIELEILKEHEGKQDKYACAFGGIKAYRFAKNGNVTVIPLANEDMIMNTLQEHLFFFFTGQKREGKAGDILKNIDVKIQHDDGEMTDHLSKIKDIGIETMQVLQEGNYDRFGLLLNKHWEIKKKYSPHSTNDFINNCYDTAIKNGSLGGKIMGAGGGGFFMFYHPGEPKQQWKFLDEMTKCGLQRMEYKFDNVGVTTLVREEI
jgi:D-glycero-alpha-D-manno-heptose-7-phosphate kinase